MLDHCTRGIPGLLAPLPMPPAQRVVGFTDQHCHMLVPENSPFQVGDMVSFGVSHPCLTFANGNC